MNRLAAPGLLVLALVCGAGPLAPDPGGASSSDPAAFEFAQLVNAHRASVGCGPLTWDPPTR